MLRIDHLEGWLPWWNQVSIQATTFQSSDSSHMAAPRDGHGICFYVSVNDVISLIWLDRCSSHFLLYLHVCMASISVISMLGRVARDVFREQLSARLFLIITWQV
jgi:hypothetical protein